MTTAIQIPTLLRIKPNTLYKSGKYLRRNGFDRDRPVLRRGDGRPPRPDRGDLAGQFRDRRAESTHTVSGNDIEDVVTSAFGLSRSTDAIVAVGGGMAIDYAKYAGFLAGKPVIAVPTATEQRRLLLTGREPEGGRPAYELPGDASRSESCWTPPSSRSRRPVQLLRGG